MCHDVDASTIVVEHHLAKAEEMRRRGKPRKSRKYLQEQGIQMEDITYKYARLKKLLKRGKQPE